MKKLYVLLFILTVGCITVSNAQLLQWNTFGNAGTETTEPSVFNDPNLSGVTNLTQGTITPAGNGNRFGGNNWFDVGDTNPTTLAESIAGNDYIEFIVTPNSGFSFTPTSFVFVWDRSGTGPSSVTLRSSADGFATDLGTVTGITGGAFATNTITISGLTNITTATTFRLYGYGATATGGTGGFDQPGPTAVNVTLNGTTASTGSPVINVAPASLTGFSSFPGIPSAPPQTYTVDGSTLTADIIITPPVGFEIALAAGGPYVANPATITLTQVAGTVPSTTIYVQMNSGALGPNTGDITHTSTGATQKDVALSGNVLANEPTSQGAITFGAITNSTIQVNFTAGAGPNQILVVRALSAVANHPVDGTTYTPNTIFGAGTNLGGNTYTVYTGISGGTVLVSGLAAGTNYHFAIYEYDDEFTPGAENYLISPLSVNDATTIDVPVIYTWIGGSSLWTTAANWLPIRSFPATNDILLFLDGTTEIVTDVPNETIGQLHVTLGTHVTLQAPVATTALTISGSILLPDLTVDATSALNIDGANGYSFNLATGTTGVIDGSMTFTGGAHRLTAADAGGITFNSGAVFTEGLAATGNPFGPNPTAIANSVVFTSGSTFIQAGGSNPFALNQPASVVVFNTGSLFKLTVNLTPSVSGRTYANFELDAPTFTIAATGAALLTMDNLTVTNGTLNAGMTTAGFDLKGNISVAAGATLNFAPGVSGSLRFVGTAPQSINNLGTLSFTANQNIEINNSTGVTLNTPVTWLGTVTFTSGLLNTTAVNLVTMGPVATVVGATNASFVNGPVSKIGNTPFTFPVGKTNCGPSGTVNGYAAVAISNFTGTPTDQFTAEYIRASAHALGPITAIGLDHVSACDYWTLDQVAGASTVDVTLTWSDPVNNCTFASPYVDNLPSLVVAHFDGANWNTFGGVGTAVGSSANGSVTWPGVTIFSPFAIGSVDFTNPLPITINYFNGTKNNGSHLLNWQVTCVSTPSATIEMERSTDARNYSSIYSIFATAVRCQQPFNYIDNTPATGVNYYRLKMTDANGKITYSSIVSLINATKGIDVMNIAPNPIVNGSFNVKISSAEKTQVDLVITDMQGRILQKQSVSMIAGFNSIPMNVQNLAAGTYQLFGNTADGRTRVLRFVIQ